MKLYLLALASLTLQQSPPTARWDSLPFAAGLVTAQTTIYYGPWQCRPVWLEACHAKCGAQGRKSMGCLWLADVRGQVESRYALFPFSWDGTVAVTHCCCDWPEVEPSTEEPRKQWGAGRKKYREEWSKDLGEWPKDGNRHWDGHHIRDLLHGGDPLARDNIIPVHPDAHDLYNTAYLECYRPGNRWTQPGPEYPYVR